MQIQYIDKRRFDGGKNQVVIKYNHKHWKMGNGRGLRPYNPATLPIIFTTIYDSPITVVLNLGSIETQGFGESVSGVRQQEIFSNKSKKDKILDTHFIFPTTQGSINACMELVGFSTSDKVKNHCIANFNIIRFLKFD